MNVANLQLQGLLMALAAINNTLVHKGIILVGDVNLALRQVKASLIGDERMDEDLSPANRDAVCSPIRLLLAAHNAQGEAQIPSFSELARMVGRTKEPYDDQM